MIVIRFLTLLVFAFCLTLFSLHSGIVGCSGPASDSDDEDGSAALSFPETCQEIQDLAVDETGDRPENGTYTLYVDGDEDQPWDAYCHNMRRAEPLEYLTVDEDENYSQVRDDENVAETTYRRLRIDPVSLEIDPVDSTFATSDFDDFTPIFPVEMEYIPLGWAEWQPVGFNQGTPAEANVSLEGTPFAFSEEILEDDLMTFFCQVDSEGVNEFYTEGTGVEVATDLTSFHLTAVNTNSEMNDSGLSTREVADCENLGTGATDFTSGAIPLQYVGE